MATSLLQYGADSFVGDVVPIVAGDLPATPFMVNGRTVMTFIDGAAESVAITEAVNMPQEYAAGTLTAIITYFTAATANEIQLEVQVEAVTDGDATDLDSTTSFDAANTATPTVPATAGHIDQVSITLTNKDSVAVGDTVRFLVRRDSDHANDDAAATMYLVSMEIREG